MEFLVFKVFFCQQNSIVPSLGQSSAFPANIPKSIKFYSLKENSHANITLKLLTYNTIQFSIINF